MNPSTALLNPLRLRLPPAAALDDAGFYSLCRSNPDYRIERAANGEIEIMPPTGAETGHKNLDLTTDLNIWARTDGDGVAFDSSTGFTLPNGAIRSPDAAWVRRDRLAALSAEQKRGFLPLAPDFVIELLSPTDSLRVIQAKMEEYRENGVRLGWMICPDERCVLIYAEDESVQRLDDPESLAADPVLPGFRLDLGPIWAPGF